MSLLKLSEFDLLTTIFVETPDGKVHEIPAPAAQTLLQLVHAHGLPGLDADCGGNCSCATCHVFVHPDDLAKLPQKSDDEDAMLEAVINPCPNSRLACQVMITALLDKVRFTIPRRQK